MMQFDSSLFYLHVKKIVRRELQNNREPVFKKKLGWLMLLLTLPPYFKVCLHTYPYTNYYRRLWLGVMSECSRDFYVQLVTLLRKD